MQSKHTPFPWFHLSGGNVVTKVGPDWAAHVVATAKTEPDAHLIVQIPAMLDALGLAYTRIFNHRIDNQRDPEVTEALDRAALEAIKKVMNDATGGESYPSAPAPHDLATVHHENARAYATIFAESPKLLTALIGLVDCQSEGAPEAFFMRYDLACQIARSVIFEATGGDL